MGRPSRRQAWAVGYGVTALVFAFLSLRLFLLYLPRTDLDHGVHVAYARRLVSEHLLLPHFAYHLLVAVAAGLSRDMERLRLAAASVLTLLVLAKLSLSLGLARWLLRREGSQLGPAAGLVLAWVLFFAAPLPNWWRPEDIYLGQLSPTAWHNPTVITLLPLAVAAFWLFLRQGSKPSLADDVRLAGLLALSGLAKPNFLLCFVPTLLSLRLRRGFAPLRFAILLAPSLAVLGWQYFHALGLGLEPPGVGMVTVEPLEVWRIYSPHPLASTLVSLAFPVAVAVLLFRERRWSGAAIAAWLLSGVAIAEFAVLAQPEPALGDGNYYWGVVPAVYLLFLVSACELLRSWRPGRRPTKLQMVCVALLAIHVASGIFLYAHPFQLAVTD